jgi:guanylate kinase
VAVVMQKLIILIGKSGSGKNTLKNYILSRKDFKDYNIIDITSEILSSFNSMGTISNKVKHVTIHGALEHLNANYIVISSLEEYDEYEKVYGRENLLPILVDTPDGICINRSLEKEIKKSKPDYSSMCRRFLADSKELTFENIYERNILDVCDNSGDIDQSIKQLIKIFDKELSK